MNSKKFSGHMSLILILVVSTVSMTVAAYLLYAGVSSGRNSLSIQRSAAAKSAADACAELALAALQSDPTSPPSIANYTIDAPSSTSCSYTFSGSNPNYTIEAIGVSGSINQVERKLQITTSQTVPQINVSGWQEIQ